MGSPCPSERRIRLAWVALGFACAGCSQAVMLTHETDRGGVVAYLYKEDRGGPMGSPYRAEAVTVMEKKCPAGYTILKEGDVRGYARLSSVEGQEGVVGRRWGFQFQCNGSDEERRQP